MGAAKNKNKNKQTKKKTTKRQDLQAVERQGIPEAAYLMPSWEGLGNRNGRCGLTWQWSYQQW